MASIILYGASGHGKVIADILTANNITDITFWDDSDNAGTIGSYLVSKPQLSQPPAAQMIISIGNNKTRMEIAEKCSAHFVFSTAIHPSVIKADSVLIHEGTVVMPGAVINADARIGS